jgi:hypothetical protein
MRPVLRRAIAPAAAAPQNMQYAADHTPVVHSLLAPNVSRQVWLDPLPLIVVEPKQVGSHRLLRFDTRESTTDSDRNRFIGFRP